MDARAATDVRGSKRTAKSCGSGAAVLALSPREAKLLGDDGGKRAVLRGEHEVSRKAIAQGRPECSRCPVCSCAACYAQIARGTAGAASTRSSLRPLIPGGQTKMQTSGASCRENAKTCIDRHCERERSNPPLHLRHYGLLRCARNDGATVIIPLERSPVARMSAAISGASAAHVPDVAALIRATKLRQTAHPPPARASGTAANPAAAQARASSPSIFPAHRYPSPRRARRARPAPAVGALPW